MRLMIALAAAVILGLAALMLVRPDSDAAKILGPTQNLADQLNTPAGRALTVAVIGPDREARTILAQDLAADLRQDPRVMTAITGPVAPSPAVLDWLWANRLSLAPQDNVTPESMATEMSLASEALTDLSQAALAGRYMLDPTGSFRRLILGLDQVGPRLPLFAGAFQAKDDSAALIFVTLANNRFDVTEQAALNNKIRAMGEADGHQVLLLGPRAISAQISGRIASRASLAAGVATVLLLGWLIWLARSPIGILWVLSPVAIGAATAALAVQATFGSVHVIALGFGGALMGLAMDYPIHLMSHTATQTDRTRALRCVALGAATTALAFLALLFTDLPALAQVGLFVAIGLIVSAMVCWWLAPTLSAQAMRPAGRTPALTSPKWTLIMAGVAFIAIAALLVMPGGAPPALVQIPNHIRADIDRIGQMIDLPSGAQRIDVQGPDLIAILNAQAKLAPILGQAKETNHIAEWRMLADTLPEFSEIDLPSPNAIEQALPAAIAQAGLSPDFALQMQLAYRAGHAAAQRPIGVPLDLLETPGIGTLLYRQNDQFMAPVTLWQPASGDALAKKINDLNDPSIRFVDTQATIHTRIRALTDHILMMLGLGAAAALLVLLILLRRKDAAHIALGTAAAIAVTALLVTLISGPLGIFQIVALVLVAGIGIDYGLFLRNDADERAYQVAASSVLRCAVTTLIAFVTMAFSGVNVLQNIGATVAIGTIAMLLAHMPRPKRGART